MRKKWTLGWIGLLIVAVLVWQWDFSEPVIRWDPPPAVGKDFELPLDVEDEGRGILSVDVRLRQEGRTYLVFSTEHRTVSPWEKGPAHERVAVGARDLGGGVSLSEGPLEVVVTVTDQPNLWLFRHKVVEVRTLFHDATPPRIEVLSRQHYLRQGGSEAVLYRVSEKAFRSGVRVGASLFQGYAVEGGSPESYLCLFALAQDQPPDTPILVWAEDVAGNRTETRFGCRTFSRAFRTSRLRLSDRIIRAVSEDILANTTEVTRMQSPIDTFLDINGRLRDLTNRRLLEITSSWSGRLLWNQPFLQLSNSKVESRFADRRIYFYKGREVDRQTHLGFDLASVARSPVEASNDAVVAFAGYLGIYGDTVVLDHGLGLFSLYGHLSSIEVDRGARVSRGDTLGRTGQTGLAAGDHLHFSMIVGGVQVTPLEWWDPKWVQEHVLSRWDTGNVHSRP